MSELDSVLAGASVDAAVFALRPDYRALLLAVDGLVPARGDADSEQLLRSAESHVQALDGQPVDGLPHIAAWRDAYRAFGAKPQRTRNSLEALTRRAATGGLPRVNRLTDLYNAVSVLHQVPIGGEDLTAYAGPPRLVRAVGDEPFDTVADGEPVVERPAPGEVVWRDDAGVTCRLWNWRQCRRTQLTEGTTRALFIVDVLDPMTDAELDAVADDLLGHLTRTAPGLQVARRVLEAGDS